MSRIKIALSVFGDAWDPSRLDGSVQVGNQRFWAKGDPIPGRKDGRYQESCWEFYVQQDGVSGTDAVADEFCNGIEPFLELIEATSKENGLEAKVEVVVEMKGDSLPSVFFDRRMVEICSRLSACIDVDLYMA